MANKLSLATLCVTIVLCVLCPFGALAGSNAVEIANDIPSDAISNLYQRNKSWPREREKQIAHGQTLLNEGLALLEAHPESSAATVNGDLLIRRVLMPIAERLYLLDRTDEHEEQLAQIALQIAQSPVFDAHEIHAEKVHAAYLVAWLAVLDHEGKLQVDREQAGKLIQSIVDAFPATKAQDTDEVEHTYPATAHGQALRLAQEAGLESLAGTYLKAIEENPVYMQAPGVVEAMTKAGHGPIFTMEARTLAGDPFAMPTDTCGKVVVIDFWATWCGPCIASMPHLKELHEAYADQGVVFVGISADEIKSQASLEGVRKFVETNKYDWTHVYYGQWPDCAVDYGVSRLPTVMVIGKDGRVLNTNARFNLKEAIEQALAQD